MTSDIVNERPTDKDVGPFFREEDPAHCETEPIVIDPPEGQGGSGGGAPAPLAGEEILEDYSEPPEEE